MIHCDPIRVDPHNKPHQDDENPETFYCRLVINIHMIHLSATLAKEYDISVQKSCIKERSADNDI